MSQQESNGFHSDDRKRGLSFRGIVLMLTVGTLACAEIPSAFAANAGSSAESPEKIPSQQESAEAVLETPISDVPLPSRKEFPRVIMGTAMFWCMPGSPRFIQGAMVEPGETILSGFYGNAPLVRSHEQNFRDLKAAGMDVLTLDFFAGMDVPAQLKRFSEMIRNSQSDLRVAGMFEEATTTKWPTDILKTVWEARDNSGKLLRNDPNIFTVGKDHVPFFLTYGVESAKDWNERLRAVRVVGGNALVVGDTTSIEVAVTTRVPDRLTDPIEPLGGTFFFSSSTSSLRSDEKGILPDFMRFGRAFLDNKVVGASVNPGYISSTRVGNLLSPRGTEVVRRQWLDIIAHNPDFVHLTMVSDYSENTEMECSANSSFTFLDLNQYFGTRWRTGQWPTLSGPTAFLSYKKTLSPRQIAEFELVVLDPKLTGSESPEEMTKRIQAKLRIGFLDGGNKRVPCTKVIAFPGHAVLTFVAETAWSGTQFAIPETPEIAVNGETLKLPVANLAPIAVLESGEEAARHWFNVPLHRVRPLKDAALKVEAAEGECYPRKLELEGIDWSEMDGVVFERSPNPLHYPLTSEAVQSGWAEPYYVGPGFNPLPYQNGWGKRWFADQRDRYFSVVRFKDGTVAFPKPTVIPSPRQLDPSVVQDPVITPLTGHNKTELSDRGPLQRSLPLGPENSATRPQIVPVETAASWWALRFDGKDDQIRLGPFTFPPGDATVELWIKPDRVSDRQVLLYSQSACFNLTITGSGIVVLDRADERRQNVKVRGSIPLEAGNWNHVVAVYSGQRLRLYVNGHPDGAAECPGARTDELTLIGGKSDNSAMNKDAATALNLNHDKATEAFAGDIARFRVLGRAATSKEVSSMENHMRNTLQPKKTNP